MITLAIILGILACSLVGTIFFGHLIHGANREVERGICARYPGAANDDDADYLRVVRS